MAGLIRTGARNLEQLLSRPTNSVITYAALLQACGNASDIDQGKKIHQHLVASGVKTELFLQNHLVSMYGKCGSLENARQVFDQMVKRNAVSWTSIIAAFVVKDELDEAFKHFMKMQLEGVTPNKVTFVTVLKACAGLPLALLDLVNACVAESGLDSDVVVATALVNAYGGGEIVREVFARVQEPDLILWNAVIAAYKGKKETLRAFQQMQLEGVEPDAVTFSTVVSSCSSPAELDQGKLIHSTIVESGCESDLFVGNAVLDMYRRCGSLEDASEMFRRMQTKDVISWNSMIAACAESSRFEEVLELFIRMQTEDDLKPDKITLLSVLNACAALKELVEGSRIHGCLPELGILPDGAIGTALLKMYGKCGDLEAACETFERMQVKDVATWTVLVTVYAEANEAERCLNSFWKMQLEGVLANKFTLLALLSGCSSLEEVKLVHSYAALAGLENDVSVCNAIISLYGNCGSVEDAKVMFTKAHNRDLVSWNGLMKAYARAGQEQEVFQLYHRMQFEGMVPDKYTFITSSIACNCERFGGLIRSHVVEAGEELNVSVENALVSMYIKCGNLEEARRIFDKMNHRRSVVTWTSMIDAAFGVAGNGTEEALALFRRMLAEGVKPNSVTMTTIVNRVKDMASYKLLNLCVEESGMELDLIVANALLNLYGRSGRSTQAKLLFDRMLQRDALSWNLMISSTARQGDAKESLLLVGRMKQDGMKPDRVTFDNILAACSQSGLVAAGCEQFGYLSREYGITPTREHYSCIAELFARAGLMSEAREFIGKAGIESSVSVWTALLGASRVHGNVLDGRIAAEKLLELDPGNSTAHLFRETYGLNKHLKEMLRQALRKRRRGVSKFDRCFGSWLDQQEVDSAGTSEASSYASLLQACIQDRDVCRGRSLHQEIIRSGLLETNVFLGNILVNMYSKLSSLEDARAAFDRLQRRNVVTWNALLSAYASEGKFEETLLIFNRMQQEGMPPSVVTFITVLRACSGLWEPERGHRIHSYVIERGCEADVIVGNVLVDMHGKCGDVQEAWKVFNGIRDKSIVSWTSMAAAFVENGDFAEALSLFRQMQLQGETPNKASLLTALHASSCRSDAQELQAQIVESGLDSDVAVANAMVKVYGKLGAVESSAEIFEKMSVRNQSSWSCVIASYARNGRGKEAIKSFSRMLLEGMIPDKSTFTAGVLSSDGTASDVRLLHTCIAETGLQMDTSIGNALIKFLTKNGRLDDAFRIFQQLDHLSLVSWNTIISAYVQSGGGDHAVLIFRHMQLEGFMADKFTFTSILNVCCASLGRQLRNWITESGLEQDHLLKVSVMNMLAKCGLPSEAQQVFDSVDKKNNAAAWNALVGSYTENGCYGKSLETLRFMLLEGVLPNAVTFVKVLAACQELSTGKLLQKWIVESGWETDAQVGIALTSMFNRCGDLKLAGEVFRKMETKNVMAWTSMIAAQVEQELFEEAVVLWRWMEAEGVKPDRIAFAAVLSACGGSMNWDEGKKVHAQIVESSVETDPLLANALVAMYGKCGKLVTAFKMLQAMISCCEGFRQIVRKQDTGMNWEMEGYDAEKQAMTKAKQKKMRGNDNHEGEEQTEDSGFSGDQNFELKYDETQQQEAGKTNGGQVQEAQQESLKKYEDGENHLVAAWNNFIAACIQHGHYSTAIQMFHKMQLEGLTANRITFLTLLAACSTTATAKLGELVHACAAEAGLEDDRFVRNSLVDVYGKLGKLRIAAELFERADVKGIELWNAMISAYSKHGCASKALLLFWKLQQDGNRANEITFMYVLATARNICEAKLCFFSMQVDHRLVPNVLQINLVCNSLILKERKKMNAC